MALKDLQKIEGYVVNLSAIPEELKRPDFLTSEAVKGNYLMCHLDTEEELEDIDRWFHEMYPGIEDEEFFFLYID